MNDPLRLPPLRHAKVTLPNGLDVIARGQGDLPLVAVNLWYHAGSKNEERRQRGFAHLFEHLMFEGSEHYPGDFFQPLQRLGASVNGSTSPDRTNYFVDLPSAHVELAVAMESDRMGHLLPALSDAKLRIQKDVVKNEYRQNYANRPYGQAWRILAEALYPPDHPYSWLTIGLMEDVEGATRDDVEAFFRRFYVPSNASLCLVGDLAEDRAIALAERYFGPIAGGSSALRPRAPEARLVADVAIRLRDRVELDRDYLAWHTVAQFLEDDAPLVLLSDVLARGRSSRLYRKLVVERELAQDVTAYQSSRELAGTFGVVTTLRPGQSWEAARALVDAELAAIVRQGIDEAELERVRTGRVAGFIYALDNVGGFGGVADRLNAYNIYLGDPSKITSDVERFRGVTAESVRQAAQTYLVGQHRATLTVLGRASTAARAEGPPLDRTTPPPPAPATAFRAPLPEVRTLRCGAPLWVFPRRGLPIVAATAVVTAGASAHGPGRGGLASLTASMLDEGTALRTASAIALATEGMGTSLSTSCGWDGSYVGLQCLTPHLAASLDLAADVLLRPSFPDPEYRRLRGQTLAALRSERDSADARGSRALLRALYGADHPYGTSVDGDESTVAALSLDDLRQFHRDQYRPGRAAWVVAGDVDPDDTAAALDALLEGWTGAAEPLPSTPRPTRAEGPRLLLLDRPGAPQSVVRVGHVGTHRLDPDFEALMVLNQVLGGQFTSRLNTKLREEKGFTYGVRSQFDFRRGAGPFSASAPVQSDRVAEAVGDILAEIAAIADDRPPTAKEADDAARALIEGQARSFESPSSLVSRYAGLFPHGLPPEYHSQFAGRVESVTADHVAQAARRHLHPSSLVAIVVADASTVADDLRRLDCAALEIFAEGELPGG